jgi:hypothetical protein
MAEWKRGEDDLLLNCNREGEERIVWGWYPFLWMKSSS